MSDDVYRLRGDRPVCEACDGTGVTPQAKGMACKACNGEGRVGRVETAPEPEMMPGWTGPRRWMEPEAPQAP